MLLPADRLGWDWKLYLGAWVLACLGYEGCDDMCVSCYVNTYC